MYTTLNGIVSCDFSLLLLLLLSLSHYFSYFCCCVVVSLLSERRSNGIARQSWRDEAETSTEGETSFRPPVGRRPLLCMAATCVCISSDLSPPLFQETWSTLYTIYTYNIPTYTDSMAREYTARTQSALVKTFFPFSYSARSVFRMDSGSSERTENSGWPFITTIRRELKKKREN